MSCLCHLASSLFLCGSPTIAPIDQDTVIYSGKEMQLVVSDAPLAPGAVIVRPKDDITTVFAWSDDNILEAQELIRRVVKIWEKRGITDYLVYGKESPDTSFNWEVVPYRKEGPSFWKQFKVLWNITTSPAITRRVLWNIIFGNSTLSQAEKQHVAEDLQQEKILFSDSQTEAIKDVAKSNDAFCNKETINRQLVLEGREIYVLYNYNPLPIGKDKLHFLLVPKQHRTTFMDLTPSEYLEAQQLSKKLMLFYKNRGYHTAYLFDKNGKEAGQSVSHWHLHVVFTATKTQELWGKLALFKNMLFRSVLSPEELQQRVTVLRQDLWTKDPENSNFCK